jgi:nucleoside-diphosphate-sugar epimerase
VAARIIAGRPIIVHGDGQSLWTLTAASDFAKGLAGLIGVPEALGETFHITHDQTLTWNSIYFEIGVALGREPRIVYLPTDFICAERPETTAGLKGDKACHAVFDNLKIKRLVPDFECKRSFRSVIRETVAWYEADPSRKEINPKIDAMVDDLIAKRERAGA